MSFKPTFKPIGLSSGSYDPNRQRDEEIDRLFQMLGYNQSQGNSYGSSIGIGLGQSSKITEPPERLKPFMPEVPKKISDRQTDNFWVQFGQGIISPVTDTLSGFKLIEPRAMPTKPAGIVGNILGSVVGWTALTVATGGIGSKLALGGRVAAGGVKAMSLGKGVLHAAGKGAAFGAFSQAHTWAWGQQKYENIPKELLVGALWGGAFGAAGKLGNQFMKNKGLIQETSEELMARFKKNLDDIVTTDDPVKMYGAIKDASKGNLAIKFILKNTLLDDESRDIMKKSIAAMNEKMTLPGKLWQKKRLFNELSNAKTMQDFDDILSRLSKSLKAFKKNNPEIITGATAFDDYKTLAKIDAYTTMNNQLQDMQKQAYGTITRLWDSDFAAGLPSLKSIHHPAVIAGQLEETNRMANSLLKGEYNTRLSNGQFKVERIAYFGDEVEEFLGRAGKLLGKEIRPDINKFDSTDFLTMTGHVKAKELSTEWQKIMKGFSYSDITFLPTGRVAFSGPANPIKDGDIANYLATLKNFPKDILAPGLSFHDVAVLNSPIGALSAKLAPVRAILGESEFRKVRHASMQHNTMVGRELQKVMQIGTDAGWTSEKLRKKHGIIIGDLMERKLKEGATMTKAYESASTKFVDDWFAMAVDPAAKSSFVRYAGKHTNLEIKASEARRIQVKFGEYLLNENRVGKLQLLANSNAAKKFGESATKEMKEAEYKEILKVVAADYIHDAMLKKALGLKAAGNSSLLEDLAKKFGTDVDHLVAAAKGRQYFDDLFVEMGLDPVMYRAAYLPHFRKFNGVRYKDIMKEFNQIGASKKEISSIFWANEMNRNGTMVMYDNNFFDAATRYVIGASKQKHFEPVFQNINNVYKKVKLHGSRAQVWEDLKESITGVPTQMQKAFDQSYHGFFQAIGVDANPTNSKMVGAMLAELQYVSGMGFNPFMPIRNLTQKALGLTFTDSGSPVEGLYWLAKFKLAKAAGTDEAMKAIKLNDILTNRVYAEALDLQSQGIARFARKLGASDFAVSKWDDFMQNKAMRMFRWSDISNVEDTFGATFMYLQHKGFSLADTVEFARATTMASQFMYGIDSPMLYKTPLGKQIGIFQSWPLNWAQLLWEQGTQGNMHRAISTVATMAVASELLTMTGLSFRSIHPTDTVRGLLPLKMLEGEENWPVAFRATASVFDYMRALGNGDPAAVDQALSNFGRAAEGLVPFGAVTTRTLRMIDRARHGWQDYADTGFAYTGTLSLQTRENTSRLVRILGETPQEGFKEGMLGWLGTTTKAVQRQEDQEWLKNIHDSRVRTRRIAIQAFINGDYDRFQKLQEQLVLNFGDWIEAKHIKQELDYMSQTAMERDARSLGEDLKNHFFEFILDPRTRRADF